MNTSSLQFDGDSIIACDMAANGDFAVETKARRVDGVLIIESCEVIGRESDRFERT